MADVVYVYICLQELALAAAEEASRFPKLFPSAWLGHVGLVLGFEV